MTRPFDKEFVHTMFQRKMSGKQKALGPVQVIEKRAHVALRFSCSEISLLRRSLGLACPRWISVRLTDLAETGGADPFDLTMPSVVDDDHSMNEAQQDVRHYGSTPSHVVVLHGGPGGAGEVEPLARELVRRGHAVLEPFQTCLSVEGQVDELRLQIERYCSTPVAVIGWSWGAWLGCLLAAQHEALVRRLALVGSGPLDARYTDAIRNTKNARLTDDQRKELLGLRLDGEDPTHVARFIELSDVADTYARDLSPQPVVSFDRAINAAVWPEADDMRESGALLDVVSTVRCPVTAIQGDYDPRPAEGVRVPLLAALPSANFVELKRCGHKPWQEIHAKDKFYRLLEEAIA